MDGFLNNLLYSAIDSAMEDAVAEALKEPEFKVYPEPAGLPLDITAEFKKQQEALEFFQKKLYSALRVPTEFIVHKTRAMGATEEFTHPACPNMICTKGYTPPAPPSGQLFWLEPKYETQPFELRFKPLRKFVLIKT
jgi:hypothetical protein